MLESRPHGGPSELTIVSCFGFGGWNVADRPEQAAVIEPVDPFERRQFDGLQIAPRTAFMNDFRLVQTVNRLGQRIVVRVANTAHRRLDTSVLQALRVADRDILGGFNWSSQHL